jgi:hypothetical protein
MDADTTKRWEDATFWIACLLLLASVAVNVVQSLRISSLRSRLEGLASEHDLRVGSIGLTPEGKTQTLRFQEASLPTVLYVFTPQCGWCKKNLPNLHALIDGSRDRYRVVGISLSSQDLNAYLEKEKLRLPVYADIKPEVRSAYQMGGTPETIVNPRTTRSCGSGTALMRMQFGRKLKSFCKCGCRDAAAVIEAGVG